MPQKQTSVITLTFNPPALRWLLIIPALLAATGASFAVRWYVGNTVAEYTSTPDADGIEMARMATRWAPDAALAHWRLGSLHEKNFSAANLSAAVREYRWAVEVGPYDFRYWLELGRALEAAGDAQNGEKALWRAVELAPSYSQPRWQYGNLLLRQNRVDEAFAQLSLAAEADSRKSAPAFALAAEVFGDDQEAIAKALPSLSLRLQFALSLVHTGKPDAALNVVRSVPPVDKKSARANIDEIGQALMDRHYYHAALSLLRDSPHDANALPVPEQLSNGGFETTVRDSDDRPFHWVIRSRSQAQISIDTVSPHSGKASLRIVFKSPGKLDDVPISQTVIVEPDTQYRLQFYVRTDALISANTPLIVVKGLSGQTLATSSPVMTGTRDWQVVTLTFKSKPTEEGILIAFSREPCSEKDPICPIFGTVWYDDFTLQRISGAGAGTAPKNRQ